MNLPQSEKPGGSHVLLAAFIIAALVLTTVYFREGDDGLLHKTRRSVQAISAPVSAAGVWVTTPFRAVGGWASGLAVSREEIETLRKQNDELRVRVAELEEARLENARLQTLVGFIEARELDAVGARVIGRPPSGWDGVITIDRGTADGVERAMPVIAPQGLLGQTIEVTSHSAKVRLITDQRSGLAAIIQPTRAEGIVEGSIEGVLSMEYVSRESTVVVGDIVLTSGMGGVYPKGLLVGEVESAELLESDLYHQIRIRPSAQVAGIEEVIVLIGAPPETEPGDGE